MQSELYVNLIQMRYYFTGELAHDLRFLASVVSQSFLAFGDILELYRKFLELSGGITRVSELNELLIAAQNGEWGFLYILPDPVKMVKFVDKSGQDITL